MQQSPDEVIRSLLENDNQKRLVFEQVGSPMQQHDLIKYSQLCIFFLNFQFKEAVKDCHDELFDCGDEYLVKWLIGFFFQLIQI